MASLYMFSVSASDTSPLATQVNEVWRVYTTRNKAAQVWGGYLDIGRGEQEGSCGRKYQRGVSVLSSRSVPFSVISLNFLIYINTQSFNIIHTSFFLSSMCSSVPNIFNTLPFFLLYLWPICHLLVLQAIISFPLFNTHCHSLAIQNLQGYFSSMFGSVRNQVSAWIYNYYQEMLRLAMTVEVSHLFLIKFALL